VLSSCPCCTLCVRHLHLLLHCCLQGALLLLLFRGSHQLEHRLTEKAAGSLQRLFDSVPDRAVVVEVEPGSNAPKVATSQEVGAGCARASHGLGCQGVNMCRALEVVLFRLEGTVGGRSQHCQGRALKPCLWIITVVHCVGRHADTGKRHNLIALRAVAAPTKRATCILIPAEAAIL